jgi:DNA-binding XRE family transcriptional regulator
MTRSTKRKGFVTADELISGLSSEARARVEARAAELISEELTLRDLRKAGDLTQEQMAKSLGVGQEHVSRLERRSDMLLSTLAGYVKAMGGDLKLVIAFPGRPPVTITRLGDVFDGDSVSPPRRKAKAPRAG